MRNVSTYALRLIAIAVLLAAAVVFAVMARSARREDEEREKWKRRFGGT